MWFTYQHDDATRSFEIVLSIRTRVPALFMQHIHVYKHTSRYVTNRPIDYCNTVTTLVRVTDTIRSQKFFERIAVWLFAAAYIGFFLSNKTVQYVLFIMDMDKFRGGPKSKPFLNYHKIVRKSSVASWVRFFSLNFS